MIELIDLPGLNDQLLADDRLTGELLRQLDGALVIHSREQVGVKEVSDLLARLYDRFPRMEGRVWMVFTRFDTLSEGDIGPCAQAVNLLDHIAKTLDDIKVPAEQVLFVGNDAYLTSRDVEVGTRPTGTGREQAPSPASKRAVGRLFRRASGGTPCWPRPSRK